MGYQNNNNKRLTLVVNVDRNALRDVTVVI